MTPAITDHSHTYAGRKRRIAYPPGATQAEKEEIRRLRYKAWRDANNEFKKRIVTP